VSVRKAFVTVAAAIAIAAAIPSVGSAATACSNRFQFAPDFVSLGASGYFTAGVAGRDVPAWVYASGISSPYAVPTASLPATFQANPLLRNLAGSYTLVCNPIVNLPGGTAIGFTPNYVDDNGNPVPATAPWLNNGVPVPGLHQVVTVS
jgi:hypothetical protein